MKFSVRKLFLYDSSKFYMMEYLINVKKTFTCIKKFCPLEAIRLKDNNSTLKNQNLDQI